MPNIPRRLDRRIDGAVAGLGLELLDSLLQMPDKLRVVAQLGLGLIVQHSLGGQDQFKIRHHIDPQSRGERLRRGPTACTAVMSPGWATSKRSSEAVSKMASRSISGDCAGSSS